MQNKIPWVEKYKPKVLSDMILDEPIISLIKSYLDKKTMCNLLLVGKPGLGKTTLARVIVNELDTIHLYINASVDNNVDTIRYKVREFCSTVSSSGAPKIVILDEADSLSSNDGTGSSAQSALRNVIEENLDDTRFILTGNYVGKIKEAIKSRCTPLQLTTAPRLVLERCMMILKKEGVTFTKETITSFHETVVKKCHPDIRTIISKLEQCSITGKLIVSDVVSDSELELFATTLLEMINKKSSKPLDLRKFYIENESTFNANYMELASKIFNLLEDPTKQLVVADHMYKMSQVLDTEVQFAAMVYRLKN